MRSVSIANRRRGLKFDPDEVVQAIAVLDAQFRFTPADLPQLSPLGRQRARRQLTAVARVETPDSAVPAGELSLVFLDDPSLAELHSRFLDDPSTTDVITFEGDESFGTAGEVCVSVDTAWRVASENAHVFADELTLYVVHGWLHLAGYDDLQPAKKRRMRVAEGRALSLLKSQEAVPNFTLSRPRVHRESLRSSRRRK
ncbi:MAG TPA: rRNA maturation RNase YbeY [Opitutaceae bacterium]|nr:rRNA maturation RNase YbeY [Opitutaceae bacterium]